MESLSYYHEKIDRLGILARKSLLSTARRVRGLKPRGQVLVAGMQRSGTNLVMDLFERSMQTDTYHERDPRAFDDYHMRDRQHIHGLIERSGGEVFVIKALLESQHLRSLLDEFAPAKALWVVRDYRDTVNSLMISFPGFAERIQLIAKDRHACGWRGEGMSDETHALIRKYTHPDINEATAAALKWYYRNILFFEQALDTDPRLRLVSYETLVTQPGEEIERVFQFVGIRYSQGISRWVSPRSIRKRPPPEIEPDVAALCEGLAERFHQRMKETVSTS